MTNEYERLQVVDVLWVKKFNQSFGFSTTMMVLFRRHGGGGDEALDQSTRTRTVDSSPLRVSLSLWLNALELSRVRRAGGCSELLGNVKHLVGVVLSSGRRRQGPAILLVQLDRLVHDFAQLCENGLFIVAVTTSIEQSWAASHKALVLFRPLDDLDIPGAVFHRRDSSIADRPPSLVTASHPLQLSRR